jgi:hypothetical protein
VDLPIHIKNALYIDKTFLDIAETCNRAQTDKIGVAPKCFSTFTSDMLIPKAIYLHK